MENSARFKQIKSWFERKISKVFKLKVDKPIIPMKVVITKRLLSYPPRSAFPSDVLKYMKKNANPRLALKAMRICKYFYQQNFPYEVVKYVIGNYSPLEFPGWLLQSPDGETCHFNSISTVPNNLCIMEWLEIFHDDYVIYDLIPKIAYCECSRLILKNQILTLNDYKLLTQSGKVDFLHFFNTFVQFNDGKDVAFERLMETLPNITTTKFEKKCAPSIVNVDNFIPIVPKTLKIVKICDPPENFNYVSLFRFIQINARIDYEIEFIVPPSLKTLIKLQQYVNNLVYCKRNANMNLQDDFELSQILFVRVFSMY